MWPKELKKLGYHELDANLFKKDHVVIVDKNMLYVPVTTPPESLMPLIDLVNETLKLKQVFIFSKSKEKPLLFPADVEWSKTIIPILKFLNFEIGTVSSFDEDMWIESYYDNNYMIIHVSKVSNIITIIITNPTTLFISCMAEWFPNIRYADPISTFGRNFEGECFVTFH